jgi:hypothetical protein
MKRFWIEVWRLANRVEWTIDAIDERCEAACESAGKLANKVQRYAWERAKSRPLQ